jgi:hypothetical protein
MNGFGSKNNQGGFIMKLRKIIAVLTAGILLVMPVTANAATGSSEGEGDNIYEHDNSTPPSYSNVIVPVVPVNNPTYTMHLDPGAVMSGVDSRFESDETVNFRVESEAIAVSNSSAIFSRSFTEVSLSDFNDDIVVAADGAVTLPADIHYIWTPMTRTVAQNAGKGQFVALTSTIMDRYFDMSTTSSIALKERSGASVNNGKIYVAGYTTPTDFSDYLNYDTNNTLALGSSKLYVLTNSIYTEITSPAMARSNMTIEKPVVGFADTSDAGVVINKATTATLFTVKAIMSKVQDIRFSADAAFTGGTASDMLYLTLDGQFPGDTTQAIFSATGTGSATIASASIAFTLDGAGQESAIKYVGYPGDTQEKGGLNWYQYEQPQMVYDSAEVTMSGVTNFTGATVQDLWTTYNNNDQTESKMKIVFSFENAIGGGNSSTPSTPSAIPTAGANAINIVKLKDPTFGTTDEIDFSVTKADYTVVFTTPSGPYTAPVGNINYSITQNANGQTIFTFPVAQLTAWTVAEFTYGGKTYVVNKAGAANDYTGTMTVTVK